MGLEITPEPDPGVRAAIARALGAGDGPSPGHPAYRSRWRLAGMRQAVARPRSKRGATRA